MKKESLPVNYRLLLILLISLTFADQGYCQIMLQKTMKRSAEKKAFYSPAVPVISVKAARLKRKFRNDETLTITSFSPTSGGTGTLVAIKGEKFGTDSKVLVGTKAPATQELISENEIRITIGEGETGVISVTSGRDSAASTEKFEFTDKTSASALDSYITVPDMGDGLTMIPTPSFFYNSIARSGNFGVSASVWGTSLGTEQNVPAVVSRLLNPQTSSFAFQLQALWQIHPSLSKANFAFVLELNSLVKKIGFNDTIAKTTTIFHPMVLQPRAGFLLSDAKNKIYGGCYINALSVQTKFDEFGKFFNTAGRNVFVYPEVTFGAVFDVEKDRKFIRVELSGYVNTTGVSMLNKQNTGIVPYLKIGFVSGF